MATGKFEATGGGSPTAAPLSSGIGPSLRLLVGLPDRLAMGNARRGWPRWRRKGARLQRMSFCKSEHLHVQVPALLSNEWSLTSALQWILTCAGHVASCNLAVPA
jgi:hypothetical protein